MNVLEEIQSRLKAALTGYADDVDGPSSLVKPTQDPKHGDYQINSAMSLGKQLGKKPRDVAQEIVTRFDCGDMFHPPEIAGPGFINLRLQETWLANQLQKMAADENLGVSPTSTPKTYVIDFSSVNVAKPLHVGHLRSTIIGDSLTRLLRFLGHKVVTDNHLGDWGTQFGMILHGYKNFLDKDAFEKQPVEELARIYKKVKDTIKEESTIKEGDEETAVSPTAEAARSETAKLHHGDEENTKLWKSFLPLSMAEVNEIYRRLDVYFDHFLGESFYNPMLPGVVQDLLDKKIAEESEGAIAIFFGENEPPALVRKSDGAFTYATTDLATIKYRIENFAPDEILYVVGSPQELHFNQVFESARRWGFDRVKYLHIKFGSILGANRKKFSTSEGTGDKLELLLDEAVSHSAEKYQELLKERMKRGEDVPKFSEEELRTLYDIIGIGAVKYADLSQNRVSDYKYDLSKMTATDGNTSTYMQYAYVRNRGIFRKENIDPQPYRSNPPKVELATPEEKALGVALIRFEEALTAAAADYQPSGITSYLWDVAKSYSKFFQECPVLKADTPELKESRLLLCDLTGRVIQKGLELLGIRTVERM